MNSGRWLCLLPARSAAALGAAGLVRVNSRRKERKNDRGHLGNLSGCDPRPPASPLHAKPLLGCTLPKSEEVELEK